MAQRTFFVDKTSRTFADNLLAFGLATLLNDLLHRQQGGIDYEVMITDCGGYFALECDPPLHADTIWELSSPVMLAKPIMTTKNRDSLPAEMLALEGRVWNYEADREAVNLHYAARQNKVENPPPLPEAWEFERAINPLTLPGYNALIIDWWNLQASQSEALDILLALYSRTPNDYASAIGIWKALDKERGWGITAEATGQQLFNPDQGKGQNKSKADGLSIGNVNGFWLAEWLKAVGFFQAALTRTVRGAKDRKTFVVAPRTLSFSAHQAVMADFHDLMSSETSIKFDILAALRYTRALLEHSHSQPSKLAAMFGGGPIQQKVVAGFDTAFYKDLGNATATMNISFIALPGWVSMETPDDITLYTDRKYGLLTHLERLTRQLDESHSDAVALLQHLRDFVSGDDLSEFLRFTTTYAGFYLAQRERGNNVAPLSFDLIERIVTTMGKSYAEIGDAIQHPGFHNIARAISESTVMAQWRKTKNNTTYQIRYGLNQELTRKAHNAEQFLEALAEFIHTYNAETARAQELGRKPWRPMVEPGDINDVLRLMDQYGNARMVAQLLVAYGYTFMKSDQDTDDQQEATS